MDEHDFLARRFEEQRAHLRAVAHRVLGSAGQAEDAVQEAWLRVSRAGPDGVESFGGWMRTVVGQVSLNILRARAARGEDPLYPPEPWEPAPGPDGSDGPEGAGERNKPTAAPEPAVGTAAGVAGADRPERDQERFRGDSVGIALLAVLDSMAPAERLAFVMHDLFAVPYDEIAPIVRRSPAATRELALSARRRMQGTGADGAEAGRRSGEAPGPSPAAPPAASAAAATATPAEGRAAPRWSVTARAFLTASRGEDFHALLALLDPDVVLHADATAVAAGAAEEVRGAVAVADVFTGRLRAARPALVDGAPGLVWLHQGQPKIAFTLDVADGTIVGIEVIADPEHLGRLELQPLDG
ncbi:sigma factor [Streptomyces synnematoformans]|uniref:Sigma-70 family RNA polymerase sigma factor n=1 Tax=Streptomyces synnematoformans TaxID=415721 RepID=A0ABN2ZAS3_9ACTN